MPKKSHFLWWQGRERHVGLSGGPRAKKMGFPLPVSTRSPRAVVMYYYCDAFRVRRVVFCRFGPERADAYGTRSCRVKDG